MAGGVGWAVPQMPTPKRPPKAGGKRVRVGAFGAYLRDCRERSRKKVPSVEGVATELRNKYGVDVDDATLRGYEYGWVERPDPVVLLGLAQIYKTDIRCFITVLAANRKTPNLSAIEVERILRHLSTIGHDEAGASARLAELQEQVFEIGTALIALGDDHARRQAAPPRADLSGSGADD